MRRLWALFVILPLFFGLAFFASAQETPIPLIKGPPYFRPAVEKYVPDEIIVKFKPGVAADVINELNLKHGVTEKYESPYGKFKVLKIPQGKTVPGMVEIYARNPNVEYAEPNSIARAFMVPNDPLYSYQWHFDNPDYGGIQMESAWNIETGDPAVVVAIVDTGVAYENYRGFKKAPDLANTTFVPGYDFINNDSHPNDDDGHGTHVTGTVAQSTNNGLGVAGIAFDTAIMPVKVLDDQGYGTAESVADGVYFATNNGADVINLSLGWPVENGEPYDPGTTVEDAIAYAYDAGVTIIAASGNDSETAVAYPAAYDGYVIAVGATRYDEAISYYSNTGSSLDLTAPGGDLTIDQNNDSYGDGVLQQTFGNNPSDFGYWFYQGTSMSTPHVVGVAALILAQRPGFTPDQVKDTLQTTAEDHGASDWDSQYGWGIVDANAALSSLVPSVSISLTTDGTTPFEILALGATQDTTSSGTNDIQTIEVTTGPADLLVKSTSFTGGVNTWTLDTANGADQVLWEFSKDATSWATFSSAGTLFGFDNNVAQGASSNLYLRLTMPTSTSSNDEHSATVTIVATAP